MEGASSPEPLLADSTSEVAGNDSSDVELVAHGDSRSVGGETPLAQVPFATNEDLFGPASPEASPGPGEASEDLLRMASPSPSPRDRPSKKREASPGSGEASEDSLHMAPLSPPVAKERAEGDDSSHSARSVGVPPYGRRRDPARRLLHMGFAGHDMARR